jgi:AcrR family transcriptional regulator
MSSDGVGTRERILQATLDLLVSGPGRSARMSDIAKAAGLSRQAIYLHFPTRAAVLIAATHYLDALNDVPARLATSRAAPTGVERLDAFVSAWTRYIPEIYGVVRALIAMSETDVEADLAWKARTADMREGCAAAIDALARDGRLSPEYGPDLATDLLWTLLSVRNWEHLVQDCGHTQTQYETTTLSAARKLFVAG